MTSYSDYNKGLLKHNAIINGNFNIWQRGATFSGSTQWGPDAWRVGETLATGVASFDAETTLKPNKNSYYTLKTTITTSQASVGVNEYVHLNHHIEGYNAVSLYKRQCVLSFWAYSNHPGTYSIFIRNYNDTSSYIKDFTIDSANTWEYKAIPVDLNDTVGVWALTNTKAISVGFTLSCGTTFRTSTLGQWISGNYICSNNVSNTFQQSVNNIFVISQVQLEVGSVATPFDHKPIDQELLDCYRYYQKIVVNHATGTYTQTGAGTIYSDIFINKMRTTPSLVITNPSMWYTGIGWTTPTATNLSTPQADRVRLLFQTTNTGYTIGMSGFVIATLDLYSSI
jgi:hypothetical protein